jgi:hypothetical protein
MTCLTREFPPPQVALITTIGVAPVWCRVNWAPDSSRGTRSCLIPLGRHLTRGTSASI